MGKTISTPKQTQTTSPSTASDIFDEELVKLIKDCDVLLLAYLLKTTTSEENVMTVSDVADQLNCLIPSNNEEYFQNRTIRRRLELFSSLDSNKKIEIINNINKLLPYVLGGQIKSRAVDSIMNGTNTKSSGKQKRFYFEPVLSSSDMDLVWGSINSNRFLSDSEKNYLLKRLHIIMPTYNFTNEHIEENSYRHIMQIEELPSRPVAKKDASLPMVSSKLLTNIQTIHEAIENEQQIEIIYGTYDLTEHSPKVDFHPRNPDKPYILNPYAMMWNGGEYYLIATHYNYKNPAHFRIDRIISVKVHTKKTPKGELIEVKRNKIPDTLKPFFIKAKGEKASFDSIKYANTYPGMKIYEADNKIDVTFECTAKSLQILIDNFGPDIRLHNSPIQHSKNELDYNGKEQTFLAATIKNIQYDNAYRFAIAQSEYLTLLEPSDLVKDVATKMQEIAKKYKKYSN